MGHNKVSVGSGVGLNTMFLLFISHVTSLVLRLRLWFHQVHLAACDAQGGQVNDTGVSRLSQMALLTLNRNK